MTDYVVGFAFSPDRKRVLLVDKNRPAWQAGKLNGVGGHVEHGELPQAAMPREFFEETGIFTSERAWRNFVIVQTDVSRVFMFAATVDLTQARVTTDEMLWEVNVAAVPSEPVLPNLLWLVPMALRAGDFPVPAIVHEHARYEVEDQAA